MGRSNSSKKTHHPVNPLEFALKPDDVLSPEEEELFPKLDVQHKFIHLTDKLHGLRRSATLAINEHSVKLQSEGKRIFRFGLGQSPFPVPEIVVNALRENAHQKEYLAVQGLIELREAVVDFAQRTIGLYVSPDQVMIGPGSKELLFLAQLSFNGDLIIPSPCWVSYIPQARIIGHKIRLIHTDYEHRYRITANKLRNLCEEDRINKYNKPRLLLMNYPGNPDGNSYTQYELEAIARVARKHNILILSDEIYAETKYDGDHVSISKYYPEGTIVSAGLSKWAGAGGWRLGTFIFPKQLDWLREAMCVIASETYTTVSAPIQYAAITAFRGAPSIEHYLEGTRRILKYLGIWCATKLRKVGVRVHDPVGAFYLFLDFSTFETKFYIKDINTTREMTEKILEQTGVAILPGSDFARSPDEFTARLAYVNFNGEKALQALDTTYLNRKIDIHFLKRYCNDTVDGIRALVNWLENIGR
ncbi:MAG: aminotransferase class I/II-fold pyridoxal phosphate-dependent enzyme [Candidatus Heimdallarchaeota archaeon]|nr:aminotransferase class I/II-fold pyridoxal phosphate-dependent enzyme [Candidatus Heimdallarchaeota archaeon]